MTWKKNDDIEEIRQVAISLLEVVPITPSEVIPLICCHPFTQSTTVPSRNGTFISLLNQDIYDEWITEIKEIINKSNLNSIFDMITKPYRLVFIKYAKDYMTKATFSEYLKEAYILSENPNMDINCSVAEIVRWFKSADKHILMTEEEYRIYENLPDNVTVFRGVGKKSNPYGISWTLDRDVAQWFSERFKVTDKKGEKEYIEKATIDKKYILAYFNGRDEQEVIVDIYKIKPFIIKE